MQRTGGGIFHFDKHGADVTAIAARIRAHDSIPRNLPDGAIDQRNPCGFLTSSPIFFIQAINGLFQSQRRCLGRFPGRPIGIRNAGFNPLAVEFRKD